MANPPVYEPVPLIYRESIRRFFFQGAFVALVVLVLAFILVRINIADFTLGFLNDPAGFQLSNQWLTDIDGSIESRWTVYFGAVWSSLRVVLVCIAASTVIGVIVGVARLSTNWVISRLAMLFVELFRNTPFYVQIIIWYAIITFGLPQIDDAIGIIDSFFISNRGIAIPWTVPSAGLWDLGDWLVGVWVALLIALGAAAMALRARRHRAERATGKPQYANRWAFGLFAVGALAGYLLLGGPVSMDRPFIGDNDYIEGMVIRPEFASLVFGLTIYTAAFNAEIVRASIQALPRGQTEAANAVGLSTYQRLTLIILPQALRQMIPSITNQYLNVWKNSSVAFAVLYADLFAVAQIFNNKVGRALEMFIVIIITYMVVSLIISAVMNILNRRVAAAER